ncbi:cation-translocating P-type ATPase [Listeria seeligeri]|uniref:cation-translocating P-type ATPase n=1 Tax=Listeria seeligeri TaxID=1640 RepID=UPI00162A2497|nr:cation-translocating P-type ATPase [Listeria seeligeri]MBC1423962.1 cation-translocating P-type ATPase [Listeria seeligeri]MBC1823449.1 cation-translocating P-type ATPase [Listeria seeligeri]MBC1838442.1 cation-translocating P-type ATPase [Listeria seeligeri]MBC1865755.1 cation-translocating P-type ATPase [Listeria seeligeri]MBC1878564.1 cation-translocating P-type ATPase [Listeria seeligeri]
METNTHIPQGLSSEEVAERVRNGQVNHALKPLTRSIAGIIRDNTFTLFNIINVVIASFIIFVGSYKNLLFLGVALCNTAMGIFQEIRAKRNIDKLTILTQAKVKVMRNGQVCELEQGEIVLGDIIVLNREDQICADGVIYQTDGLEVDESQLTGESEPVIKKTADSVMSGSFIVSGQAYVEVSAVGEQSFVSKISMEVKQEKRPDSELIRSIKKIIKVLTFVIIPLGLALFFSKYLQGLPLRESVLGTSAAMIGMIPEGLVLLTSIALAVGVINLAKQKVLVKSMPCIETLARVDVLCLDKTGTITDGKLDVTDIILKNPKVTATQISASVGAIVGSLADNNATSIALRKHFVENPEWQTTALFPFSSARKWSGCSFAEKGTFLIGAPEFIFKDLSLANKQELDGYANQGFRVLAVAHADEQMESPVLPEKSVLLAYILIADNIREEAPSTFAFFANEGVSIKVISGDNPVTVSNVAVRAGIVNGDKYIDMNTVGEEADMVSLIETYTVFGRVTPHQKRALIKAYQKQGHTVAMTGDGVNDVLALKEADCSIAMAEGSDAARSVSDFVLLSNNFDSMIDVLREGRRVVNNIERVAALYLIKTMYSTVLALTFIFVPGAYPFQPIQLSPISSLTVGIPSFFLALKPNYDRIKGQFLHKVLQTSVPAATCVIAYIMLILAFGNMLGLTFEETSTMNVMLTGATCFVALISVGHPFGPKTKLLVGTMMAAFVCLFLFAGQFFSLVPIFDLEMMLIYVPLLISCGPLYWFIRHIITRFSWAGAHD